MAHRSDSMRAESIARIRQDADIIVNRDTALVPADTLRSGDVLTYDRRFAPPRFHAERTVRSADLVRGSVSVAFTDGRGLYLRPDHLVRVLVPQDNLNAREAKAEGLW